MTACQQRCLLCTGIKQVESIDKIDIIKCKVQSDFIISVKFNLLQGFIIRNKEQKKQSEYLNIFA